MGLVVHKYGGTSVADADRMRAVADHVRRTRRRGDDVVVVISAMGKETDDLIRTAADLSDDPPGREMDMLITAGERKASALMCMALDAAGVPAASFTGSQAGFLTDTNHTNARILEVRPDRVRAALDAGLVPVIGGSQGVSTDRDVTFLGRGGTDTTAVALAEALDADACELYTDVSGVFTTDPQLVPEARKMDSITFDELLEMTATGCPKPAMRSVEIARTHGVPLYVRSAFTWEPGTWVLFGDEKADEEEKTDMEQPIIRAVTQDASEAKVTVSGLADKPGIAATLFRGLADQEINIDMIVQNVSEHGVTDISFTVPHEDLALGLTTLEKLTPELGATGVTSDSEIARVSIIGTGMKSNPGVAATMFETLAEHGVNIEMISTSAIRTSCVVREEQADLAVQALHEAFELHDA